ncbi:MAG TPA: hypothetical protein PK725_17940 [Rhodocyclaceae bacterium]|nr:hypothetical protein [Rhodocyclaceae bacterium]
MRNGSRRLTIALVVVLLAVDPAPSAGQIAYVHADLDGRPVDLADWHPEYRQRCLLPGGGMRDNAATRAIAETIEQLGQAPQLGGYLLDAARRAGTVVCIDERADLSCGYYDYQYNTIALGEALSPAHKLIVLVHELRHIDTVTRGYRVTLDYDVKEMVRLTYAVEADAQAITALHAWRVKQRGTPGPWFALLDWELYTDIARALEREFLASGDESQAMKAAFEQWYASPWRLMRYRENCYMGYLDLQDETKRVPQYAPLPEDFFDDLCLLPDGRNYGCHQSVQIRQPPRLPFDPPTR